jgi:hypothetical protein
MKYLLALIERRRAEAHASAAAGPPASLSKIVGVDSVPCGPNSREATEDELTKLTKPSQRHGPGHEAEVLSVLSARRRHCPARSDPYSPWPATIGPHPRTIEALSPCMFCGAGTWARYGAWRLCLACARQHDTDALLGIADPPPSADGDTAWKARA